jgi:hypothetical protein
MLLLTSSPSMNGRLSSVRRTLPTVLFPQPAGPVTIQMCCMCALEGLQESPLTPLARSGMMFALLPGVESTA